MTGARRRASRGEVPAESLKMCKLVDVGGLVGGPAVGRGRGGRKAGKLESQVMDRISRVGLQDTS